MANIIDKLLDSMKLNDDDDLDEDFDEYEDDDFDDEPEPAPAPKRASRSERDRDRDREEEEMSMPEEKAAPKPRRQAQPTVVPSRVPRNLEVCMIRPKSVEEGREICDTLLSGRAVVINLEGINMDVAQRIIDFTSGACYSMNGNLQKISSYIFIATPQSVELSGDFQEILEGNIDMSTFNINL